MEDEMHGYEGELIQIAHTHETRPPKVPDKIPINENSEDVPERMPRSYREKSTITPKLRHPHSDYDPVLAVSDSVDVALNGSEIFYRDQSQRSEEMWWVIKPLHALVPLPLYRFFDLPLPKAHRTYIDSSTEKRQSQPQDEFGISTRTYASVVAAPVSPAAAAAAAAAAIAHAQAQAQAETQALAQAQAALQVQSREEAIAQEMETLRRQLKDANSRADQAERVAEELEHCLKAGFNDTMPRNTSLDDTAEALASEVKMLKAELDDARSHIFSLQPYRKDLTPEEVGRVSYGPGQLSYGCMMRSLTPK